MSSNAAACLKAMKDAGEDMESAGTRFSALSTCEGLLLLKAAWTDPALTGQGFLSGLRALGTRFAPALTFATDFSSRADGASQFRAIAFDGPCDCFVYKGATQTAR